MTAALKVEADIYQRSATARNVIPLREAESAPQAPSKTVRPGSSRSLALQKVKQSSKATVQSLPQAPNVPLWLNVLIYAQRGSSVLMVSSVVGMLSVYGWTVHIQDSWGQEYQRLQNLLQQERQLTTSTEALKQQVAETAEDPSARMALPAPGQMLFLEPAVAREPRVVESEPVARSPRNVPIGY